MKMQCSHTPLMRGEVKFCRRPPVTAAKAISTRPQATPDLAVLAYLFPGEIVIVLLNSKTRHRMLK